MSRAAQLMSDTGYRPRWHGLVIFWVAILVALGAGAGLLQSLGPPAPPPTAAASVKPVAAAAPTSIPAATVIHPVARPAPPDTLPGRGTPGPVADPDPALQEPAPGMDGTLPRIAEDGRMPMQVYAAGFDHSSQRPRVGLLLAGIGLNSALSEQAIRTLPGAITLAVSPYAQDTAHLLTEARMAEHEYLISIPMEPESYPLNDPGNHALTTSNTPDDNAKQLVWALSRIVGYVGATGALGLTRGERFASIPVDMDPVLTTLAARGLLYVDPRPAQRHPPGGLPHVWSREVDLVIDEPDDARAIDAKLAALVRIAQQTGSALGLAGAVRPVTVERIAAWANELAAQGVVLAPVSALVQSPVSAPTQ
ncbi:MAG TPA: divergent polysaccharide deacetylase family protein [Acetobacteraceae bacterium]